MPEIHELSPPKTWWAAVWRGLVVDETGKHHRTMKGALWLFVYLNLHADRKTGTLFRRTKTIAQDMCLSPRTVRKYLATLRDAHYIVVVQTGRALRIKIEKWKPVHSSVRHDSAH